MQITINVPEIECSRCSKKGTQQPTSLRRSDRRETQTQDNLGNSWQLVGAVDLPKGWCMAPGERPLCEECSVALTAAVESFIAPTEPEVPEVSWADAQASARVQKSTSLQPAKEIVRVTSVERAEISRNSNIPQFAPSVVKTSWQHAQSMPVLSRTGIAQVPAHAPNIIKTAVAPAPPAPRHLYVTQKASGVLEQKVATSQPLVTGTQKHAMVGTIPQRPEEKVTVLNMAPPNTEPARVDPMVQPAPRQDTSTRVDRVIHAEGASVNRVLDRDASPGVITVDQTFTIDDAPAELPALTNGVHDEFGAAGESGD